MKTQTTNKNWLYLLINSAFTSSTKLGVTYLYVADSAYFKVLSAMLGVAILEKP